ncbi:MAG TPA: nucleotidyl transferase AbiEii/AbiGii toxin family protein [Gemmataceae bacterium]|nr:nucleotidyl transferase AbiEii/AbiGii toxin family protein [Gemmataceae bacterium]
MSDDTTSKAYHEDSRRFRDALTRTASDTGFSERLIEKDYYCSVLLKDLQALFGQGLVFKGGTCLSKVHAEFFRLSEDLDFGMSLKPEASRGDRRRTAEPMKRHLAGVVARLPVFSEVVALTGQNNNKQYNAKLAYRSLVTGAHESIKIEVSLREEVLLPSEQFAAKTMLTDPLTNAAALPPIVVRALSLREAYAEKVRAALTRRDPAIRDFFDIDNAVRKGLLECGDPEFLGLVSQKIACTEDPVDTSTERIEVLARQIESQLKPVLRPADYEEFALARVVALLLEVIAGCGRK